MLGAIGGLKTITVSLEISIILAVLAWLWFKPFPEFTRRRVWIFGGLWVLFITVEFWVLGPFSFVHHGDEGEVIIPLYTYLSRWHDGGRLAHGVLGDTDAYSMLAGSMTKIAPGVLLLDILPIWAALGIHKIVLSGTGFMGAYLLARRGGGADRQMATAIAASFVVAHNYLLTATLTMGFLSFAVYPLAVYIFVFRLHKKNYFSGVTITSALIALGVAPTNSGLGLGFALLATWAFTGFRRAGRFTVAIAILLVAVFANWHEKLFAFLQMAPFSYRGTIRDLTPDLPEFFLRAFAFYRAGTPEAVPLVILSLAILWLNYRKRFWLSLGMIIAVMLSSSILAVVPWREMPIAFLSGVRFTYVNQALPVLLVLTASWAAASGGSKLTFGQCKNPMLPALFFAFAIGQAASLKVFHLAQWVGMGGQSIYFSYNNLSNPTWAPKRLFRTVTVPYRLSSDIVSNYGLESFDGFINLPLANKSLFWEHTMFLSRLGVGAGHLDLTNHSAMDYLCCKSYSARKILNIDALRVGNTEFVISTLPFTGGGLIQVSGPKGDIVPPRRNDPMVVKIMASVSRLFHPINAYVYKIPEPLPRAFVAKKISHTTDRAPNKDDYAHLVSMALKHYAVVSPQDADVLGGLSARLPKGRVLSTTKAFEGYNIDVEMPQGGVLIVNTPWVPYWRASSAGKILQVVEANAIHSAIKVPVGANRIEFRYARPMLRDYVLGDATFLAPE